MASKPRVPVMVACAGCGQIHERRMLIGGLCGDCRAEQQQEGESA